MARRSIDGKRVLVTGASSGIGRAVALHLAQRHCRLLVTARREERLEELKSEVESLGGEAIVVAGDLTHASTRQALIDRAKESFSGIDAVINNAGIGGLGPFADANEERLRQIMEVNFFAPAELTRSAIPLLEQSDRPIIVNISSVLGHRAVPMKSEYCTSKFAMHGWSDAIRAELVDRGIDVLLVSPSTTDSNFFENVIDKGSGRYAKMSRAQSPEYVARRIVKAMERGKHEIILSWSGWGLVWLDRLLPSLADRIVARYGKS